MKITQIKVSETFKNLFPINDKVISAIEDHMKEHGYDYSQPIVLWSPSNIVVDGHCRLIAAQNVGLTDIPTFTIDFADEDEALAYAIHNQRDRRNLTDADIARLVELMDKRKQIERDGKGKFTVTSIDAADKSAKGTAEIIGTSQAKVERTRTVLDHADKETKQAVLDGEKSIHKAYTETQKKRRPKGYNIIPESNVLTTGPFEESFLIFKKQILEAKREKFKSVSKKVILGKIQVIKNILEEKWNISPKKKLQKCSVYPNRKS